MIDYSKFQLGVDYGPLSQSIQAFGNTLMQKKALDQANQIAAYKAQQDADLAMRQKQYASNITPTGAQFKNPKTGDIYGSVIIGNRTDGSATSQLVNLSNPNAPISDPSELVPYDAATQRLIEQKPIKVLTAEEIEGAKQKKIRENKSFVKEESYEMEDGSIRTGFTIGYGDGTIKHVVGELPIGAKIIQKSTGLTFQNAEDVRVDAAVDKARGILEVNQEFGANTPLMAQAIMVDDKKGGQKWIIPTLTPKGQVIQQELSAGDAAILNKAGQTADEASKLKLEAMKEFAAFQAQKRIDANNAAMEAKLKDPLYLAKLETQKLENQKRFGEHQKMLAANEKSAVDISDSIKQIDNILRDPTGLEKASGWQSMFFTVPGSDAADYQAVIDTIKSDAFQNSISLMSGMGSLSDAEGKKVQSAIANLELSQSDEQAKEQLMQIRNSYSKMKQIYDDRNKAIKTGPTQTNAPISSPVIDDSEADRILSGGR